MITSPDKFAKHISVAASRALRKKFACAGGQLIVTTPIQAVKLATTKVTGLPSPFDKNELELWNSIQHNLYEYQIWQNKWVLQYIY